LIVTLLVVLIVILLLIVAAVIVLLVIVLLEVPLLIILLLEIPLLAILLLLQIALLPVLLLIVLLLLLQIPFLPVLLVILLQIALLPVLLLIILLLLLQIALLPVLLVILLQIALLPILLIILLLLQIPLLPVLLLVLLPVSLLPILPVLLPVLLLLPIPLRAPVRIAPVRTAIEVATEAQEIKRRPVNVTAGRIVARIGRQIRRRLRRQEVQKYARDKTFLSAKANKAPLIRAGFDIDFRAARNNGLDRIIFLRSPKQFDIVGNKSRNGIGIDRRNANKHRSYKRGTAGKHFTLPSRPKEANRAEYISARVNSPVNSVQSILTAVQPPDAISPQSLLISAGVTSRL
jgi:hypothetical protein